MSTTSANNPHDICTWRTGSECTGCSISGSLKCRFRRGDLLHFMAGFLGFAIPAFAGMIAGRYGWYILGEVAFMAVFFTLWEIRILCSHCPYYAERGRILHCIANYGSPKLWRYHPEPMSLAEKVQLIGGFIILAGYPFPFLVAGRQWVLGFLALWGGMMFFWTLVKDTCTRCVNFSCPLNRVPKEIVDAYLRRNPVMRRAWEAAGWELSPKTAGHDN